MNWLARLKNEKALGTHATKPTKPGFVGFVAPTSRAFQKIKAIAGDCVTDAETAKNQNAPSMDATKATKPGFVGFVAYPHGPFQKIEARAPLPEVGAGEVRSAWWRIRFADREPLEAFCVPPATREEMLASWPDAIAVEPFEPAITPPARPLNVKEEQTIRRWLALIGETDQAMIAGIIRKCQSDAATRANLLERAAEELDGRIL
jgi:hypothetical protein